MRPDSEVESLTVTSTGQLQVRQETRCLLKLIVLLLVLVLVLVPSLLFAFFVLGWLFAVSLERFQNCVHFLRV